MTGFARFAHYDGGWGFDMVWLSQVSTKATSSSRSRLIEFVTDAARLTSRLGTEGDDAIPGYVEIVLVTHCGARTLAERLIIHVVNRVINNRRPARFP
jgi:hypothetical protein